MAPSTKVKFDLKILQEQSAAAAETRVRNAQLRLEELESDQVLEDQVAAWRTRQESRISDLFRSLGEADNQRISTFRIEEIPTRSPWESRDARRQLADAEAERDRIAAKAGSIKADEDGNVSLTKTQLKEFFGL